MVTAARVREVLNYFPETGEFTWRVVTGPRAILGAIAGSRTQGYINISVDGRLYRAHRLAWLYVHNKWPRLGIDHINGNGLDNRLINLREATQAENTANARKKKTCKSGFKGVTAYRSKWVATVGKAGRKIHLGCFDTREQAHAAYCSAAKRLHGEFARSS